MPVTVATSFLVISLNALVRPNSKHRDAALLLARQRGDDEGSDGDHGDSSTDSDSDSEEDSRRPFAPSTTHSASQTRAGGIMSTSQAITSTNGGSGTIIPFGVHSTSANSSSTPATITPGPTRTLPFFSQTGDDNSTGSLSTETVVSFGTNNSPNRNVRISNGAIIGMTLGIVFSAILIWLFILKMVKRKRRARKLPRGFIPSTILVDNQSFRASVTELPVAGTNTTTTGSTLSNGNGRALSISPFAALRLSSPSPPPQNPPPPPGLTGISLRRSSQQTTSSSYHANASKPMSARSLHREERIYPEEDPLYLAVPPPPPPARGTMTGSSISAPNAATSSVESGLPSPWTASSHPYRTSPEQQYDVYYEGEAGHAYDPNSHHDPPPSYGQAF